MLEEAHYTVDRLVVCVMKISLQGRAIPRTKTGDPCFRHLMMKDLDEGEPPSVLHVFTMEEVVELVNRALYQLEYQAESHRRRAARQREAERPVKLALKRVHPQTSWAKATPGQIQDAVSWCHNNAALLEELLRLHDQDSKP